MQAGQADGRGPPSGFTKQESRRDWKLEIVLSAPDQWKALCWNWLISA
jgi:hypothetical protein